MIARDVATVFLLLLGGMARAADVYVDAAATGADNGTSWANAYRSLETALTAAAVGTDVLVAAGAYTPTARIGGTTERHRAFQLKNGVRVRGGYPRGGGVRNVATNLTVLTGDIGVVGVPWDNCYHVLNHLPSTGLNSTAVLDGVTIRGGNADGSFPANCGGGMFSDGVSPTLIDCTFEGCEAGYGGGAVYIANGAAPTLLNCVFRANRTRNTGDWYGGGAVYVYYASPALTNCVLTGNLADDTGGGYTTEAALRA